MTPVRGDKALQSAQVQASEGDIVATRVAGRYALGRVTADGEKQAHIESQQSLEAALERACALAGADQRVFLVAGDRYQPMLVVCKDV